VRPSLGAPDATPWVAQSFYYDEKPMLSNEEFDNLKEELLWEGSKVAVLRCGPAPRGRRSAACRALRAAAADGAAPSAALCRCALPRTALHCLLCRADLARDSAALPRATRVQASAAPRPSRAPQLRGAPMSNKQ